MSGDYVPNAHECTKDIMCLSERPHMWFYGGWMLRRPDGTHLRTWRDTVEEGKC